MNFPGEFIFFEKRNDYLFKGIINKNQLEKLYVYNLSDKSIVGNIYRGRIVNKIPGINGFFVDIGESKNAFFQIESDLFNMFKSGEEELFQVISDEIGNKGSKVTTKYELKGEYFILTPFKKGVNISKKIIDVKERERLLDLIESKLPNNLGGVIRTEAQDKEDSIIIDEIEKMLNTYFEVEKERNFAPTPKLIFENDSIFDIKNKKIKNFITNDKKIYDILKNRYENVEIGLFEDFKIKDIREIYSQLKELFKKNVKLRNGIELVFEKTEAFNVIDVNSAGYINKKSTCNILEDVNLNCIEEILKHIEFRNLCGIILVDLISFSEKPQENSFIESLKKILKESYNGINFHGITNLGILELTRNRRVNNLALSELDLNIFE